SSLIAPLVRAVHSSGSYNTRPAYRTTYDMSFESTILLASTPAAWVDYAVEHWPALLVDHANCEKKAASTALSLMFTYPEDRTLTGTMSRLAREELRHFEQVQRLMDKLG